jgi:sensor histidine kinase YesM
MRSDVLNATALDRAERAPRWLRRSLAGLTPRIVAIVAALLFLRAVDTSFDVLHVANYDLVTWLGHMYRDYRALLVQAVPMVLIVVATGNLGPQGGWQRVAALAAAVVASAAIGGLLRLSMHWRFDFDMLSSVVKRYTLLGALLTLVMELYRTEVRNNRLARQADVDRAAIETEISEARLQALRAQIEPHFLFNTLANARRLYAEDHALGRSMLDALMRYFEMALPKMRQSEATLGQEVSLVDAFLSIHRIRMVPRLTYRIDVPRALMRHRVPPMVLLTLVENAIKHGIAPQPDGGLIRIRARRHGDRLELTVADTGAGFGSASGTGVGLANVSARLKVEFGARAALELANNEFGGATATIVLPCAEGDATDGSMER